MATEPPSYKESPLQLVAFNDVEDELFGAPGTPDRDEYENKVKDSMPIPLLEENATKRPKTN